MSERPETSTSLGEKLSRYLDARRGGNEVAHASDDPNCVPLQNVIRHLDNLARAAHVWNENEALPKALGKYQLVRSLAEGGQSRTFLAHDDELQRLVVIKVYHQAESAESRDTILREGRMLSRVNSPYVVRCLEFSQHDDTPYLILECVSGVSLAELIATEPQEIDFSIKLVARVAQGLSTIHQAGLLHRDIKPANIVVDNEQTPRLVDFGISMDYTGDPKDLQQGTPRYMSPELARFEWERVDQRSDLFSLGTVLYEMLTGKPVYPGNNKQSLLEQARRCIITPVRELRPELPSTVSDVCMRCLSADPSKRPASAQQLVHELNNCLAVPKRHVSGLIIAGVVLALVSAALYSFWPVFGSDTSDRKPLAASQVLSNGMITEDILEAYVQVHDWERIRNNFAQKPYPKIPDGFQSDFLIDLIDRSSETELISPDELFFEADSFPSLFISASRNCYAAVFSIEFTSDTSVPNFELLFPRDGEGRNLVEAGRPFPIPASKAEPSQGPDFLYIVTWTGTLPGTTLAHTDQGKVGESSLDRLRGLRRRAAVSERLIPYTVGLSK